MTKIGAKPINRTAAWEKLQTLRNNAAANNMTLKGLFKDSDRAKLFGVRSEHMFYDFSRQLADKQILTGLIDLAKEAGLESKIKQMFSGEKLNTTENRAVLHTALRNLSGSPVYVDGKDVMGDVKTVLDKIEKYSSEILEGSRTGVTGKRIKNIVSVGIGGSYLGPEYLAEACGPYAKKGMKLLFISNIDGTDFARKTASLEAEETLFVIVSKTFTTAETMKNANTARKWMKDKLGDSPDVIKKHFIAVSTAEKLVKDFGIDENNIFGFWDWVGGRFSATSAVGGVPLSLFLGYENFHKILEGASWMDRHFLNEPFEKNIPVLAGLLDIWNTNFMGYKTRAILPYSQAWLKYAPHCQQAEMESNGKLVDRYGDLVNFDTGEIVFGEPGTNGQHSFYQLLHQGTTPVPADFIGFINPQYNIGGKDGISHHEELMTNFFAQPDALAFGQDDNLTHKKFPGNRASNVFLMKNQDPFAAGLLLAFLEHRVAVKGFIWGINSFDQWGVQLGKTLAVDIKERICLWKSDPNNPKVSDGLNASTANTLKIFLGGKF